mmetsp:Transcript_52643/g.113779  ORF Transcript_52643/g.113779 Transcript_52643/m.113779 type:complete len:275 (+) Transcript_52643:87-911(+)
MLSQVMSNLLLSVPVAGLVFVGARWASSLEKSQSGMAAQVPRVAKIPLFYISAVVDWLLPRTRRSVGALPEETVSSSLPPSSTVSAVEALDLDAALARSAHHCSCVLCAQTDPYYRRELRQGILNAPSTASSRKHGASFCTIGCTQPVFSSSSCLSMGPWKHCSATKQRPFPRRPSSQASTELDVDRSSSISSLDTDDEVTWEGPELQNNSYSYSAADSSFCENTEYSARSKFQCSEDSQRAFPCHSIAHDSWRAILPSTTTTNRMHRVRSYSQ